MEVLAVA